MAAPLNVSLEPHLRDTLTSLLQILPRGTCQQLTPRLSPGTNASQTAVPVIPYELLLEISRWCQTADGKAVLQARSPPLDPHAYTMVSLLAGTRTSPEKHFPPYIAKDPEKEECLRAKDRKAIASLVNAVLSVVGTGVATWWASEHTGMRLEWRALLAVGAALVVAFAEIVLYMIWESRLASGLRQPVRRVVHRQKEIAEGSGGPDVVPQASSTAVGETNLRHRTTTSTAD